MSSHDQSTTEPKPRTRSIRKDNAVHASLSQIHLSKSGNHVQISRPGTPKRQQTTPSRFPSGEAIQNPEREAPERQALQAPPPMDVYLEIPPTHVNNHRELFATKNVRRPSEPAKAPHFQYLTKSAGLAAGQPVRPPYRPRPGRGSAAAGRCTSTTPPRLSPRTSLPARRSASARRDRCG
jgi:hypothetical protein